MTSNLTITPRKYQIAAKDAFLAWAKTDERLATIILPTGTGKSFLTSYAISELNKTIGRSHKVLWVAHREELIFQAVQALKLTMPDADIQVEMAKQKASANADIIVGSVQTLHRHRKNIHGFTPEYVVVDEWHHYHEKNKTYHGLMDKHPEAKFLGLTATPYRFKGGDLPLGKKLIDMDIGTAVSNNYLVPPAAEVLRSGVSLANVKARAGDFAVDQLAKAVNVDRRNKMIVDRVVKAVKEEGRQGLLFAVDVAHSKALADMLRKHNVKVREVYGETDKDERRETMALARKGEVDVIVNNLCLTEGTDLPMMSFACIARPTKSMGLYIQIMGRVLRLFAGKKDALIIDVHDTLKATQSCISFADVAASTNLEGGDRLCKAVMKEKLPDTLINFPVFIKRPDGSQWLIDTGTWFAPAWVLAPNQWVITWTKRDDRVEVKGKYEPIKYPPSRRNLPMDVHHKEHGKGKANFIVQQKDSSSGFYSSDLSTMQLNVDFEKAKGKDVNLSELSVPKKEYESKKLDKPIRRALYIQLSEDMKKGRVISLKQEGYNSFRVLDSVCGDKGTISETVRSIADADGMVQLLRADARWRTRDISDKQKAVIQSYINRGTVESLDIDSMTMGDASGIMDQVAWAKTINQLFGAKNRQSLIGYGDNF